MGRTQRRRRNRNRNGNAMSLEIGKNMKQLEIDIFKYLQLFNWQNKKKLYLKESSETGGYGVCSKLKIDCNDFLLRIPFKAMISLWTLETDIEFKYLIEKLNMKSKISFQSLLTLYILIVNFYKDTTKSKFSSYIKSIPAQFTNPYFCTKSELYFVPENLLEKIVQQNLKILNDFKIINDSLSTYKCSNNCYLEFFKNFNLIQFKWAFFAINTRCIYLDPKQLESIGLLDKTFELKNYFLDEPNIALAPFLDMFNHSDKAKTKAQLIYDNSRTQFKSLSHGAHNKFKKDKFDCCKIKQIALNHTLEGQKNLEPLSNPSNYYYELITEISYSKYEQCFISYGNLNNFKLLLEYGFIIKNNLNDYFEITLNDIEEFLKEFNSKNQLDLNKNKFKFIKEHNLNESMFLDRYQGISHNLKIILKILFKIDTNYVNILNQFAYGESEAESEINDIAEMLINFKIKQYNFYKNELSKLGENLSSNGKVVLEFIQEAIGLMSFVCKNFLR